MARKITPRGRTVKFRLNEDFLFGAPRCMSCGCTLKPGEIMICLDCRRKRRGLF